MERALGVSNKVHFLCKGFSPKCTKLPNAFIALLGLPCSLSWSFVVWAESLRLYHFFYTFSKMYKMFTVNVPFPMIICLHIVIGNGKQISLTIKKWQSFCSDHQKKKIPKECWNEAEYAVHILLFPSLDHPVKAS